MPSPLPLQYSLLAPIVERVLPRAAVELSVASVYGDPSRIAQGVVDRYYDMARRAGNRRALFGRMAARREERYDASRLQAIAVPTLVIWGGRDDLIPVGKEARGGRRRWLWPMGCSPVVRVWRMLRACPARTFAAAGHALERGIPGARLVVYEDLGHIPQEEDPARTVAAVLDFLGSATLPEVPRSVPLAAAGP